MTTPDSLASAPAAAPDLRVPVDPEHGLLRFAVILTFIVSGTGSYFLFNVLLGEIPFINLIAIGLSIAIAVVTTRAVESGMQRRWPSGRYFEIDGQRLRLGSGSRTTREIDGSQHVNVMTWRFTITKRTRVPKGWYVVALAMMQDDLYLPLYTFMSPEDFDAMPLAEHFPVLTPSKTKEQGDLRLAGQQRRLRTAEYARWNEGAELTRADFDTVLAALREKFPMWMIAE
jgi:hypothetical protein